MPGTAQWTFAFQIVNLCVLALVWVRMRRLGLQTRYPVFSWYLVFRFCRSAVLLCLDTRSTLYFRIWGFTEPVVWVFYALLVRELYGLALAAHTGIQRLSGWLFQAALAVGLAVAAFSVWPQWGVPGNSAAYLFLLTAGRFVAALVMVFLLFLVGFLNWYPVSLSRNLILHAFVFAAYFLSFNINYLWRAVSGVMPTPGLSLLMVALPSGLAAGWLFMTRAGETRRVLLREKWSRGREAVLVGHLDALNEQLMRVSRK